MDPRMAISDELRLGLFAKGVYVDTQSDLHPSSRVHFEAPVSISRTSIRASCTLWGAYSYIRDGRIASLKSLGRFCSIAPGLACGDNNHALHHMSTHPFQYKAAGVDFWPEYKEFETSSTIGEDVMKQAPTIGNDVWIGTNVTILRGVTIGDGAVIAANALVREDVPPYAVVAGLPGKVKKMRFPEATIERLLRLKWWQYTLPSMSGLDFTNVDAALDELERRIDAGAVSVANRPLVKLVGTTIR